MWTASHGRTSKTQFWHTSVKKRVVLDEICSIPGSMCRDDLRVGRCINSRRQKKVLVCILLEDV